MMNKFKYLIIFLFLISGQIFSQSLVEWTKNYGGTNGEDAYNFISFNSGFILLGLTESNDINSIGNHGGYDISIIRIDSIGNVVWSKCFGGSNNEFPGKLIELQNGDLAIVGHSYSIDGDFLNGSLNGAAFLMIIDSLGQMVSLKFFGGIFDDDLIDIVQDSFGNILACGITTSTNLANSIGYCDVYLVKLDSLLNLIWEKTYGGTSYDIATKITLTSNNQYILGGKTVSIDGDVHGLHGSMFDILMIKCDSSGTLLNSKCFGGTSEEALDDFIITDTGDIIFVGNTFSIDGDVTGNANNTNAQGWIAKIDSGFHLLNQRCVGGNEFDECKKIKEINRSYFLACSISNDDSINYCNYGFDNVFLYQIDSLLNLTEIGCYGGNGSDVPVDFIAIGDSIFIFYGFSGSTQSYYINGNYGLTDLFVFKINKNQLNAISSQETYNPKIYYNGNYLVSPIILNEVITLVLYDLNGRTIFEFKNFVNGQTICKIPSGLQDGMYIGRIVMKTGIYQIKFIKK